VVAVRKVGFIFYRRLRYVAFSEILVCEAALDPYWDLEHDGLRDLADRLRLLSFKYQFFRTLRGPFARSCSSSSASGCAIYAHHELEPLRAAAAAIPSLRL
jgi:hypothetical protein